MSNTQYARVTTRENPIQRGSNQTCSQETVTMAHVHRTAPLDTSDTISGSNPDNPVGGAGVPRLLNT
jgi:hypothetical protein